jgi:hypothetical protein
VSAAGVEHLHEQEARRMACEVEPGERLGLVTLDVENEQVDLARPRIIEQGAERPARRLDVVVGLAAATRTGQGVGAIGLGRALRAVNQRHQPADRDRDGPAVLILPNERTVEHLRPRPLSPASLIQLRHGLDEQARPPLDALEVVGIALEEAVVRARLDEEAISLGEIRFQLPVQVEQGRSRIARRAEPFEEPPADTRRRPCVRLDRRVLENRPDARRERDDLS